MENLWKEIQLKGPKDRNRHKIRIKRSGLARLLYVKNLNRNIPTTWMWGRGEPCLEIRCPKDVIECPWQGGLLHLPMYRRLSYVLCKVVRSLCLYTERHLMSLAKWFSPNRTGRHVMSLAMWFAPNCTGRHLMSLAKWFAPNCTGRQLISLAMWFARNCTGRRVMSLAKWFAPFAIVQNVIWRHWNSGSLYLPLSASFI